MSSEQTNLSRAAQLRAAFDASFSHDQAPQPAAQVDLLAIQVAGHGYVLRLAEVLAVHAERKLVQVPSPAPALLGLVGLRGQVVPIYDLGLLLGYPPGPVPRWLAVVRAHEPFGLGFESFESHLRVPESAVVAAAPSSGAGHAYARGSVSTPSGARALIDLPALVAGVTGILWRERALEREERR